MPTISVLLPTFNRLALLQTLLKEFSTIADFSEIVTEGK